MSLTPKNQRFPYDEEGKIIESATTMYQIAEKRVKKIREEDFFRNGAPDDFFVVPKKIDIKEKIRLPVSNNRFLSIFGTARI